MNVVCLTSCVGFFPFDGLEEPIEFLEDVGCAFFLFVDYLVDDVPVFHHFDLGTCQRFLVKRKLTLETIAKFLTVIGKVANKFTKTKSTLNTLTRILGHD